MIACLAAAAGCSLFVDTTGLGGPVVEVPAEGGSVVPPVDAGGDADAKGDVSEAGPTVPLCGTPSLWCTTFDDGLNAFTTSRASPGTTLTIDGAGGTTGPGLQATADRTSTLLEAVGIRSLPTVRQDVRIRFAMRVEPIVLAAGDRGTHFAQFKFDVPGARMFVTMELLVDKTIAVYVESGGTGAFFGMGPIELGVWQRFDVTFGPTTRRFKAARNDVVEVDRSDLLPLPGGTPTFYEVLFGTQSVNTPNPPVTFRFDDVRVDAL